MTDLVIGCPVQAREWVLPRWFEHVERACDLEGMDPEFVFVVSMNDEPTLDLLDRYRRNHIIETILTDEPERKDERHWDKKRYEHMVVLRNALLHRVRQISPKYFWSLDSDILPSDEALFEVIENFDEFDAVGMLAYMDPHAGGIGNRWEVGRAYASKGDIYQNRLVNRAHQEGETTHKVQVIMASKVMKRPAYMVDYRTHVQGEDVGWSLACGEAGLKLGWCPEAVCKHVMSPAALDVYDARVGF
jgi:hypothetical protein